MKLKMTMKKLTVLLVFLMIISASNLHAQASWEIGGRFGDNVSAEATIPIGAAPRLKPAFYFSDQVGVAGYLDWMFKLRGNKASGLKFFPGVGTEFYFENDFDFSVAGDFGVEYAFSFPITIGFDWRPAIFLTNERGFDGENWGFLARFRFGERKLFEKAN